MAAAIASGLSAGRGSEDSGSRPVDHGRTAGLVERSVFPGERYVYVLPQREATTRSARWRVQSQQLEEAGRLVVRDGRIVLLLGNTSRELTGLEIFRVAVRGVRDLNGTPISPDIDAGAPGVTFHAQPAQLVLLLREQGGTPLARASIRHRGEWVEVNPSRDHCLVNADWYPLDAETLTSVRSWLVAHGDELTTASYIDAFRGLTGRFRVVDELSESSVEQLAGGSGVPAGLHASLYPYQKVGLQWLSARATAQLGGILADEMGLGKTLQIIALIAQRILTEKATGPALIMVPATLVENWGREFAKFAPSLTVYRHVGATRTRRPHELAKPNVVLTTYETAGVDLPVLDQVTWDTIVVDEAQAIKNPDTQRWVTATALTRSAAFAVTGTPLENRTLDTWSLATFVLPGYLGTRSTFESVLADAPELLRDALRPLVLRREVNDVVDDLPDKIEVDVALEMFSDESELYRSVRNAVRSEIGKESTLALITRLRMFTAHPDSVMGPSAIPEARSSKLTRLLEILQEVRSMDAKVLVFVAFTTPADIITSAIQRCVRIPVWTVDGRTPVGNRMRIVDDFSSTGGPAALVLNPAAAGVGLNIQAASHVVHYTLEWNPAKESQATARAWRRGQMVPVTVHRLFYSGTIDELILGRLAAKRDLFERVVVPTHLAQSDLRELLEAAVGPRE